MMMVSVLRAYCFLLMCCVLPQIQHSPINQLLFGVRAATCAKDAGVKFQVWQAQAMLNAASRADINTLQRLLERGCSADVCDYDKRTALMLAAANGHEVRHTRAILSYSPQCLSGDGKRLILCSYGGAQQVFFVWLTCSIQMFTLLAHT